MTDHVGIAMIAQTRVARRLAQQRLLTIKRKGVYFEVTDLDGWIVPAERYDARKSQSAKGLFKIRTQHGCTRCFRDNDYGVARKRHQCGQMPVVAMAVGNQNRIYQPFELSTHETVIKTVR